MKPTKLVIKNIGKIASETIEINKPMILFYGEIKQGKTTILNSVRWVCGGEFPDDIIRHGEKEGGIELHFDGGMIARSFYRSKDGVTKARPVTFVKAGRPVPSPVAEIKRMLNPFLLDQDFLRNKTELERKQYFAELFAVDTTDLDTELFNNQRDATALRSKIAGYGEIDLTEHKRVDAGAIQAQLDSINTEYLTAKRELEGQLEAIADAWQKECQTIDQFNDDARVCNNDRQRKLDRISAIDSEIKGLKARIIHLQQERAGIKLPALLVMKAKPTAPDRSAIQKKLLGITPETSALQKQLQDAGAANVRAEQFERNKALAEKKKGDEAALSALEKRGREIKAEKQAKLKSIGDACGIKGLSFDETGNFIYDGTMAGMISDSQIMQLSSELSALYPEGFGLDLIDRAESLGKSIFEFVDRAKAENKSILATIVGEQPAKVPADVGVFVVDAGKITEGKLL